MANTLKLALVQMDIHAGHPDDNFARLAALLERAAGEGDKPDAIVVPEMWNTGYALEAIRELADAEGARTRSFMSEFSKKHGINVVAGSVAASRASLGGAVTNTSYAFDRSGGQIAEYSKIHLFKLMDEHLHLEAGERPGRFELEGVPAGAMICYDIRFPELARRLALDGAKVLFVPAEWPHPRLHHWRTLLQARAIENQMYVVACNRSGTSGTTRFFGHSMVIDPWGEVIAEAGEEETILRAEIDLALTDEVRARIPVFDDRRPSLY
ncbi:carbon-nitrogen family hydrolase [Cohnella sp. JJ-181]|uniref:carbon-nitrogen family hydrolase n=1 Tax=Cohnella rhizoplanae TaxID=2974897 RepID=UPI0022FF5656|nr:carbon-nitrogen family hydrolase [Cohnella sp. JJ-181]CAI6081100.1 Omega-amidase YafV [Cohnella sp. JJ-181]